MMFTLALAQPGCVCAFVTGAAQMPPSISSVKCWGDHGAWRRGKLPAQGGKRLLLPKVKQKPARGTWPAYF
jgi:hypothetical protein